METNQPVTSENPAELVMETVAMVMRAIRREMREHRPAGISIQQFRALGVVHHHPGASLSMTARHLGLTTASASKLIDSLVNLGLVTRHDSAEDRRKVELKLTRAGERALEAGRQAALGRLMGILAALHEEDRNAVIRAMHVLRETLADEHNQEVQ